MSTLNDVRTLSLSLLLVGAAGCYDAPTMPDATPLVAVGAASVVAPPTFTAVDLGTLPGHANSIAYDIQSNGHVAVGVSYTTAPLTDGRPVLWTSASPGSIRDLGLPPGATAAEARAINAAGVVVGSCMIGGQAFGFVWTRAGGFVTLAGPPGAFVTLLRDVNDNGVVVGSYNDGFNTRAFKYTQAGGYTDLHPAGYIESAVEAINNNDVMVGRATTLALEFHAAGWDAGGAFTDIGGLGTPIRGFAWDINDRDHLVGHVNTPSEAFAMPFGGGMTLLAGLSIARGISARNRIVGSIGGLIPATMLGRYGAVQSLPLPPGAIGAEATRAGRCGHSVGFAVTAAGARRATGWLISACD